MSEITLEIPDVECPDCGHEIDLEDDETRYVVIVICPKCNITFQYEDEPKYH